MKKFLSIISTFVLTVLCAISLAACGGGNAEELLKNIIIPNAGSSVSKDFGVPGKLKTKDAEYDLTWTSDKENLKVATTVDDKGQYLISVVRPEDAKVEVKLTAGIKDMKGSKEFAFFVNPYDVFDFADSYTFPLDGKNLYGEYQLDTELTLPNAAQKATIKWTTDSNLITIDDAGKMNVKLSFEKVPAVLKAEVSYKTEKTTVEYKVNVLQQDVYTPESELKENTEYVLGLLQVNLENSYLWMTGEIEDKKRGVTTKDLTKAASVYVEKLENGNYHLFHKKGDAKKYFTCTGDRILSFTDDAQTEWAWDAEHKTLLAKGDADFFLGTYSTYDNISLTEMKHIGGNFIAQFYTKEGIEGSKTTFSDDVKFAYEVEHFKMYDLNPGNLELQTKGKKFSDVAISYELAATDNAKLNDKKDELEVNVIAEEAQIKLTVTFKLGEKTESKDVTLKIKATVDSKLSGVYELKDGTPVTVTGKIVAKDSDGIVIQDETGSMYVRTKDGIWSYIESVGKAIKFTGLKGSNYGAAQLKALTKYAKQDNFTYTAPEPVVYDKAKLEASLNDNPVYEEIEFTATVSAGKYLEAKLADTEKKFSLKGDDKLLDQIKLANTLSVMFRGFVAGSNTKVGYVTVIVNNFRVVETDEAKLVKQAKNNVLGLLPTEVVEEDTQIVIPDFFGATLEVTAAGKLSYDAASSTLTITPALEAAEDNLKIVLKIGEKTETIETKIKTKLVPNAKLTVENCGVANKKEITSVTINEVTFAFAKAEGATTPTKHYYDAIRMYGHNQLTISSTTKKFVSIEIVSDTYDEKYIQYLKDLTVEGGTIKVDGIHATITCDADCSNVVILNTSNSQVRLASIKVILK